MSDDDLDETVPSAYANLFVLWREDCDDVAQRFRYWRDNFFDGQMVIGERDVLPNFDGPTYNDCACGGHILAWARDEANDEGYLLEQTFKVFSYDPETNEVEAIEQELGEDSYETLIRQRLASLN